MITYKINYEHEPNTHLHYCHKIHSITAKNHYEKSFKYELNKSVCDWPIADRHVTNLFKLYVIFKGLELIFTIPCTECMAP